MIVPIKTEIIYLKNGKKITVTHYGKKMDEAEQLKLCEDYYTKEKKP